MVLRKIQGWHSGWLKPCFLQLDGRRLTLCSPTETRKERPVSSTETHASCCQQMGNYKAIVDFLGSKPTLGEGNGTPLQSSCLENPMDGGACWAAVHGSRRVRQLSDFTFPFHFHALEKEMATHSSVLAWRTPGTGEPGGLPSIGSHRVGHD